MTGICTVRPFPPNFVASHADAGHTAAAIPPFLPVVELSHR